MTTALGWTIRGAVAVAVAVGGLGCVGRDGDEALAGECGLLQPGVYLATTTVLGSTCRNIAVGEMASEYINLGSAESGGGSSTFGSDCFGTSDLAADQCAVTIDLACQRTDGNEWTMVGYLDLRRTHAAGEFTLVFYGRDGVRDCAATARYEYRQSRPPP